MKKNRILAGAAAVIMTVSAFSGCGGSSTPETNTNAGTSAQPAETSAAAESSVQVTTLSNPVALTPDGDIDMEVALAYQTDFDALKKQLDEKKADPDHPVSENTNEETLALFKYLKECYADGKVLSAQMLGNKNDMENILYYYVTDDLPAIKGFDFIFKTTPDGDGADWTQMAIDWHTKSNGIVYFQWHWNVPCNVDEKDSNAYAFYSEKITNFSLANAVTPGTKEYEVVIHDIDLIAKELQRLEAAGVPVLWRPLHEASGKWFWWGIANKEVAVNEYYQKLWYMIFDRLENYHKLTNLIWVWNGQSKHTLVHENTYDISGIDVYPDDDSNDHSVQENSYNTLKKLTADGKMLTLSECGFIPDSDELAANKDVKWLFYMPWNFEFVYKGSTVLGIPKINETRMTNDFLRKIMSAENIITWSELPDFEGTERNLPEKIESLLTDIEKQRAKDSGN